MEYLSITIIAIFSLAWSSSICLDAIYGSNRFVKKLFVFEWTLWKKNLLKPIKQGL